MTQALGGSPNLDRKLVLRWVAGNLAVSAIPKGQSDSYDKDTASAITGRPGGNR